MSVFPEYLEIMPALPVLREGILGLKSRAWREEMPVLFPGVALPPTRVLLMLGRGPDRFHRVRQRQEARVCMAGAVQLSTISGLGVLLSAAETRGQLGPGLRPVNTV